MLRRAATWVKLNYTQKLAEVNCRAKNLLPELPLDFSRQEMKDA